MIEWTVLLGDATTQPSSSTGGLQFFLPLIVFALVFYVIFIRGQRKDQKHRQTMINTMSKNDKVLTIGGIFGTVVSVKEDEVVIKIDESTNTKMTITKRAVAKVIREEDPTADRDAAKSRSST